MTWSARFGTTGSHVLHAVIIERDWYSGMRRVAECGAVCGVLRAEWDPASASACKRCVKSADWFAEVKQ